MVSRCGAFKKGTTPMTLSPHVHRGTGFSPWKPVPQGHVNPQWCPQQGEGHPNGAVTIATDSGDFLPEYHSCRTFSTASNPPQPRHLRREKPGTARGTTTAPPATTRRPHHHSGVEPASPLRRRGAPPAEYVL
jgi:hypothetical protein